MGMAIRGLIHYLDSVAIGWKKIESTQHSALQYRSGDCPHRLLPQDDQIKPVAMALTTAWTLLVAASFDNTLFT